MSERERALSAIIVSFSRRARASHSTPHLRLLPTHTRVHTQAAPSHTPTSRDPVASPPSPLFSPRFPTSSKNTTMADSGAPLIGSLLSVLTKSQIRYEGVMCNLDIANSTVALQGGECIFHWERGGGGGEFLAIEGSALAREWKGVPRPAAAGAPARPRTRASPAALTMPGYWEEERLSLCSPRPGQQHAPRRQRRRSPPPPPIPRLSHAPPPPHPFPLTQSAPSARRTARRRARPCRPRRRCTTASFSKVKKRGGIGMGGGERGEREKKQKATDLRLRLAPPLLSRPPPPPHSPRSPLPSHRRGHRRPGRPEQWPGRAGRAGAAPAAAPARGE